MPRRGKPRLLHPADGFATLAQPNPGHPPPGSPDGIDRMSSATLFISSRNYSSWSLRGWLMTRLAGLDVVVQRVAPDDPAARLELLMRASSILLPTLVHDGISLWDTLAIAEYLHETFPNAKLYPADRAARARARSISGEMHSGFEALRASLPMNLRRLVPGFAIWSGVQADIDRICAIWRDCLAQSGGPYLFGAHPTVPDAMYAPVATRFVTYDVKLDPVCGTYVDTLMAWPFLREWRDEALREPEEIEELDV